MNNEELKQQIKQQELRLSQLRKMDTQNIDEAALTLIQSLEDDIIQLKKRLGEE
jgi:hypothetical protein